MFGDYEERKISRKSLFRKPFVGTFNDGTGISIKFANGNHISIIFGEGSYSNCKNGALVVDADSKACTNVEVNISGPRKCLPDAGNDKIEGYVSPDKLADIIHCLATGRKKRRRRK